MANDICSVDDCGTRAAARGYCNRHWKRWRRYGDPLGRATFGKDQPCQVAECDRLQRRNGLCDAHSQRLAKYGTTELPPSRRKCLGPDCDREVDAHQGFGLCRTHYAMQRRGSPLAPIQVQPQKLGRPKVCTFEGCENPHKARGYCKQHAQLIREGKPLRPLGERLPAGPCSLPNCDRPRHAGGYCARHWSTFVGRVRRYGLQPDAALALYEEQGRRCAACEDALPPESLVVDHDHACECHTAPGPRCGTCVRGLICMPCNLALGHARDSVDRLLGLARYLQR